MVVAAAGPLNYGGRLPRCRSRPALRRACCRRCVASRRATSACVPPTRSQSTRLGTIRSCPTGTTCGGLTVCAVDVERRLLGGAARRALRVLQARPDLCLWLRTVDVAAAASGREAASGALQRGSDVKAKMEPTWACWEATARADVAAGVVGRGGGSAFQRGSGILPLARDVPLKSGAREVCLKLPTSARACARICWWGRPATLAARGA